MFNFNLSAVRIAVWIRAIVMVCGLVWAAPAWAQFTLVGQNVGYCMAATSCNLDASITAQAGDLSIVSMTFNAVSGGGCVTGVGVSDATNGAYAINAANDICDSNNTERTASLAYYINSGAAALTPAISWTGSSLVAYWHTVWRPTGTVTADQFNENENSAGTSHSHGSITTTGTGNGLIVTMNRQNSDGGAETVATGFTAGNNNQLPDSIYDYTQYKITTTGETTTAAYTTANSIGSLGVIASFLDDGGGGAATPCTLSLLGVGKCE